MTAQAGMIQKQDFMKNVLNSFEGSKSVCANFSKALKVQYHKFTKIVLPQLETICRFNKRI